VDLETLFKFISGTLPSWLGFLKPSLKKIKVFFTKKKLTDEIDDTDDNVKETPTFTKKQDYLNRLYFVTEYTQGQRVDRGKLKLEYLGKTLLTGEYVVCYELNENKNIAKEDFAIEGYFIYDHLLTLKFENTKQVNHAGVFMLEMPQSHLFGTYIVYYPPKIPADRQSIFFNGEMPAQDVGQVVFWPIEREELADAFISNRDITLSAIKKQAGAYFG
jgi:hypothetical protein